MTARVRAADRAGQLPQRLRHQPSLEPDVGISHLPLDLGPRHQGSDRVHDHDIQRAGPYEDLRDLERLFSRVGLRHKEVLDVHAETGRVLYVEGMLGIHERRHAAISLSVGDDVERQRRLARRLGPVDL